MRIYTLILGLRKGCLPRFALLLLLTRIIFEMSNVVL